MKRHSSSWLDRLLDLAESIEHNSAKTNLVIALGGAIGTTVLWWVHFAYPGTFPDPFYDGGRSNFIRFVAAVTPPFLMVFALAHAVLPRPGAVDTLGPMSSFMKQQASVRLWKISIIAAAIAGLNLLFMLFTGIQPNN